MGQTLGVVPVRRQHLNDGTYLHKDDVVAVLKGYAMQLDENGRLPANSHPVDAEAVMHSIRHEMYWWAAREFVRMADYLKGLM
jgi:hypothetical protein